MLEDNQQLLRTIHENFISELHCLSYNSVLWWIRAHHKAFSPSCICISQNFLPNAYVTAYACMCNNAYVTHHKSFGPSCICILPFFYQTFYQTTRRAPLVPWMGPLYPVMGLLMPKIDPCRPGMDPPTHINCLFSLNVGNERLQYLAMTTENGPRDRRGGEISPLSLTAPLLAAWHPQPFLQFSTDARYLGI